MQQGRTRRPPATPRSPNPGFNPPFTDGLNSLGAPWDLVGASTSENPSRTSPDWVQLWTEPQGEERCLDVGRDGDAGDVSGQGLD